MSDHPPTEAEQAALALRYPKIRSALLDWRVYASITALTAVVGLMLASYLFWHDSQGKDDAAACRANAAAQLRDSDSEVIRQIAFLKEYEADISSGWSRIVVKLSSRQPGDPPATYQEEISQIDFGQTNVERVKVELERAIDRQASARAGNLASIRACGG